MDLQQAISSHAAWKQQISIFNEGQLPRSLDPSVIARDNVCQVGEWLSSLQPEHGALREFADLKQAHANFHSLTAKLVMRIASGERLSESDLGPDSEYGRLSARVIGAIKAFWIATEE